MSGVRAAIGRSFAIGLLTLAIAGTAQLVYLLGFCRDHAAWARVHSGRSPVILGSGLTIARPGDGIFACETTHMLGPFALHEDLKCYCAPKAFTADAISRFLGGSCTVDKPAPTPSDAFGACRFARCSVHLDP